VDEATGATVLTRDLAVDDAGVTIDQQAATAQIHGGIAQGAGEVVSEESVIDPASGQPYAASLMDYMLPRAHDFPTYQVMECNAPSPFNPLRGQGHWRGGNDRGAMRGHQRGRECTWRTGFAGGAVHPGTAVALEDARTIFLLSCLARWKSSRTGGKSRTRCSSGP
jgi:hypothetical protein